MATNLPTDYADWLASLKESIRMSRLKASLAVNGELVTLYWRIGREILERQSREGWGTQVVEQLATDLRSAFPEMTGFSPRNLKYMRAFAEAWPDFEFVQQAAAQIPWRRKWKPCPTCRTGRAVPQALNHTGIPFHANLSQWDFLSRRRLSGRRGGNI